jgi:Ca2+-binding RTX toxin-like protein
MATFIGTAGTDNFQGTAAADDFYFYASYLTSNDVAQGGGTVPTDGLDRLFLSGVGALNTHDFWFDYSFYNPVTPHLNLSGFEQIYLSATGTEITFTGRFLNSSQNGKVEVFGSGSGNDNILVQSPNEFIPRTGQLIAHGGDGNDTISNVDAYSQGQVVPSDILYGDAGNDTIFGFGTLYGGSGDDSITVGGDGSKVYGGLGNDTIKIGYSGLSEKNMTVDGGDGLDVVLLYALPQQLSLTSIEYIYLPYFWGNAAEYASLQQYSGLLGVSGTSSTYFHVGGGGTFDFTKIANGTFDATIENGGTSGTGTSTTIIGSAGHNNILGGSDTDVIYGGSLSDILDGGDGGKDYLYGGNGNDTLIANSGGDFLYGGNGDDLFRTGIFGGFDNGTSIFGGDGNDRVDVPLTFLLGSVSIDGGSGYDALVVGSNSFFADDITKISITGFEFLYSAGTLTATISQLSALSSIYLANGSLSFAGNGTLDLSGKIVSPDKDLKILVVADSNLTLTSSSGNDYIRIGHSSSSGDAIIDGGDGNDTILTVLSGNSTSLDSIYGGNGNDTFIFGTQDIIIIPGTGVLNQSVSFFGGAGDDTFSYYQAGIFDGGDGIDTINVATSMSTSNIKNIENLNVVTSNHILTTEISSIGSFQHITIVSDPGVNPSNTKLNLVLTGDGSVDLTSKMVDYSLVLSFTGQTYGVVATASDYSDLIHGTKFDDVLSGGAGDDQIYTGAGHDVAYGGLGNDILFGEFGNDTLIGGSGDDTIITSVDYTLGISYVGGNSYVDGGAGNDYIVANGVHDYALGGSGNDILTCETNAPVYLLGQDGSDVVAGGDGNDYLSGGMGSDVLYGGGGIDYFVGGSETDYFIMNYDISANDYDYISDFTAGIDYIGLSAAMKGYVSFVDTAYGVDIACYTSGGFYQILLTGVHDIAQVKASVYYDGV